jgi:hypothetical protein
MTRFLCSGVRAAAPGVRDGSWTVRASTFGYARGADDQGNHLPNVKVGCQTLRGQKRAEMMY